MTRGCRGRGHGVGGGAGRKGAVGVLAAAGSAGSPDAGFYRAHDCEQQLFLAR